MTSLHAMRAVLLGLAVGVALVLQTSVFPHLAWRGVGPDVVLLVVVAGGLARGAHVGMVLGFASGLVLDLAPPADHVAGRWALALLVVGVGVLGSGPLKDLALALFIGMAAGTYSSICIATPLAVQLRERDPAVKAHTKRVLARRAKDAQVAAEHAAADDADPVAAGEQGAAVRGPGERRQPSRPPRSARKGGTGSGGR